MKILLTNIQINGELPSEVSLEAEPKEIKEFCEMLDIDLKVALGLVNDRRLDK